VSVQAEHSHERRVHGPQLRRVEAAGELPQAGLRVDDGELLDRLRWRTA